MKILVTGGNGQLGTALKEILSSEEVLFTDTDNMDITNSEQINQVFDEFKPDFLVHGAAFTNVDGCEENPDLAQKVNAQGTFNLAKKSKELGSKMIYISTDYVFDGEKEGYSENDQPNPLSVYGKTKLEGEKSTRELANGWVLRTSWVYGEGKNFVLTMLSLADKLDEIKVVNDQIGRPTYALDLARAIFDVIKKQPEAGIYNVTGDGEAVSWAGFAAKIFELAGKTTKVTGISTKEYFSQYPDKKIAKRPKFSILDLTKAKEDDLFLADWEQSLTSYLNKQI
jgi:dTDP-4-dehydrorhamnose reductase